MKRGKLLLLILLLIIGVSQIKQAFACSLAVHDWKLVFFVKLPISAPVFPLAEFNFLKANFREKPADKVFWVSKHGWLNHFLSGFVHAIPGWPAEMTWNLINSQTSILGLAQQNSSDATAPIIMGSDLNFLKIAFFSDYNSNYSCHQLVVMNNSRIRGVLVNPDTPWAQEMNGMSWVSLIFYQLPYPGRIMSFSAFPYQSARVSLFEDHDYVESLLMHKLLKRRPDMEIDPFIFDFPELPD